jgi:hypothetical protein
MYSKSLDTLFSGVVLAMIAVLTFGKVLAYTPWL